MELWDWGLVYPQGETTAGSLFGGTGREVFITPKYTPRLL